MCSDERGWAENPLVYCDGQNCNVAVHQGTNTMCSTVFLSKFCSLYDLCGVASSFSATNPG